MTENDKIITTMRVFELIKNIPDPCEMLPIIATSLDFWCKLYGEDMITITENLAEAAQMVNIEIEGESDND